MGACIKLLANIDNSDNAKYLKLEKRKRPKRKVENRIKSW